MKMNPAIFREYDIRGDADSELTIPVVESIGRAIGTLIRQREGGSSIALGRDCRLSSSRIRNSLIAGLTSTGMCVVDIGLVPTPLLYFSVFTLNVSGGVMITGSHNPAPFNGFKICLGKSTIHGEDIQLIKDLITRGTYLTGVGSLREENVTERYFEKVLSDVKNSLHLKIVVDSGNGMAGPIASLLYEKLGCKVTSLYSELDGSFPNHHPDPTESKNLKDLITSVRKNKAVLGIAFDGDADRIGVVDRSGRCLFGDELLILYARQVLRNNPGATIISEVKASHRLYQDIRKRGGEAIMWRTGHSLIKSKMKDTGALLAGEMSGHMFFSDRYFGYDDAIYAGARLLEIIADEGKSPGDLLSDLPPTFSTPEIRIDCPDSQKFKVVQNTREWLEKQGLSVNAIDGARIEFEDGWGLVRASNTQPVLVFRFEATTDRRLSEIRTLLESAVSRFI